MGIVAIFFPRQILAEDLSFIETDRDQPGGATCFILPRVTGGSSGQDEDGYLGGVGNGERGGRTLASL